MSLLWVAFRLILAFKVFDEVYLLTGGGPVQATTTLIILAFQTVFATFKTGPGTAIAFMMTGTLVVVSLVLFRLMQKSAVEQ